MTGWTSKRRMANMTPVLPASWQEFLLIWERTAVNKYLIDSYSPADSDQDIVSDCMDRMQARFPGPYTLKWHRPAPNEHHLTVHFEDPKQETMWRMRFA